MAVNGGGPLLDRILEQPEAARALPGFTILKDERSVTVYSVGSGDGRLCVKEHRPGNLARRLRRSRARTAFKLARAALELNLRVAEPLAALDIRSWGLWRRGLMVTRFVAGLEPLPEAGPNMPARRRLRLARELADAVRRLHDGGWVHADLKLYNLKVDRERRPWLFDLERGYRVGSWPAPARDLAQAIDLAKLMASSAAAASRRERLEFLARYLRGTRRARRRRVLKVLRFYSAGPARRQGKTLLEIALWPKRPPQ